VGAITLSLPSPGQKITAGLHSTNYAALQALLNGNLDATNLADGAVTNVKLAGSIALSKLLVTGTPDATKFLRGDGSWQVPSTAGVLIGVQILSVSSTYTPTAGTNRVYVECVGGGGGGGGVPAIASGNACGGGGGGGAYAASLLTSGFSGVSYTIGAAGAAISGAAGGNGGDTIFGSNVVVAKGGSGGTGGVQNTYVQGGAGGQRGSCVGQLAVSGGRGTGGPSNALGVTGTGGDAALGFGLGARQTGIATTTHNGNAPDVWGAGGSGGFSTGNVAANNGGAGSQGLIRVWEFA